MRDKKSADDTVERAFQDVNVVDETNLNDVMLTVADPNEAVTYFTRTVAKTPNAIDFNAVWPLALYAPNATPKPARLGAL